jgi:ribose/xylose/arabinose/galactoside ABC-type transport system permease subunit
MDALAWSLWLTFATGLVASPAAGLAVGAALFAGVWWRRGPALLGLAAATLALGVVVWITAEQLRSDFPSSFGWPEQFVAAHVPTLTALALLVAHVMAVALRTRREPDRHDTDVW